MRDYSPYPLLVDVCVTNRCNLSCSYCSAEAGSFASKKERCLLRSWILFSVN